MNVLKQLQAARGFTEQERAVAFTILEDPEAFLRENGKQLARRSYTSQATLYRLCAKLDCTGLADLKLRVSGALESYRQEDGSFNFDFPILPDQSTADIVRSLREDYAQTVIATQNLFDAEELERCVAAMCAAEQIDVYTSAGNVPIAQNFRFQMAEIGVRVHVPVEEYEQRLAVGDSDETHLAIVISFGGRGMLVPGVVRVLRERKTPILLIASAEGTPVDSFATYRLSLCERENHYLKISSFSTRLSLLYVLDCLYAAYFSHDYASNFSHKLAVYSGVVDVSELAIANATEAAR